MKHWVAALLPALLLVGIPVVGLAQEINEVGLNVWSILSTIVYGLLGISLFVVGYLAFDRLIRLDLRRELVEDQNTALGIMLAGLFISIAIIVASAII